MISKIDMKFKTNAYKLCWDAVCLCIETIFDWKGSYVQGLMTHAGIYYLAFIE